jgi:hypothetical protein
MCGCRQPVIRNPRPTHQFETIPVVTMVPESTPTPEIDHFNNIDIIEPINNGESETNNNE